MMIWMSISLYAYLTLSPCLATGLTNIYEAEFKQLYLNTEDKDGLESIRALHQQLDDDQDGAIEPSETADFIRSDLNYKGGKGDQSQREKMFHHKDNEITVKDLWSIWHKSEVHNWTVDQTVEWLQNTVELPQYVEKFRNLQVTGSKLPQIAVGSNYLTKVLGISNPIHRSKITLKAMDIVLFGPSNRSSTTMKEIFLSLALGLSTLGLFYAFRLHKRSQKDIQKMICDMKELSKAEETLKDLQDKFVSNGGQPFEEVKSGQAKTSGQSTYSEVTKLKEEVEILRHELQRAENELEDKAWFAPKMLQTWLQLTYELEAQTYNARKKAAGLELETVRLMCEKIKLKRVSLIGAFVSTHAGSIDEAERLIADSRGKFEKLAKELTDLNFRWKAIESLCGCSIFQNPGLSKLQKITSALGMPTSAIQVGASSRGSFASCASQNELDLNEDNSDVASIAASSQHSSHTGGWVPTGTPSHRTKRIVGRGVENIRESGGNDAVSAPIENHLSQNPAEALKSSPVIPDHHSKPIVGENPKNSTTFVEQKGVDQNSKDEKNCSKTLVRNRSQFLIGSPMQASKSVEKLDFPQRSSSLFDLTGNKMADDVVSRSSDVGTKSTKSKIGRFFSTVIKKNKKIK